MNTSYQQLAIEVDRLRIENQELRLALRQAVAGELDVGALRPFGDMTADDISKVCHTAADFGDNVKAWCPPELCDKAEELIRLIVRVLFKPERAMFRVVFSPQIAFAAFQEFQSGLATIVFTPEQLETLRRLVHNVGELQKTGDLDRTQVTLRGIADGRVIRRILAWFL